MWRPEGGTVRDVVDALGHQPAYTTIMTIMNNLASKGLLTRVPRGKAHFSSVALSRDALLAKKSGEAVEDVLARFGDLAVPHFLKAVAHLRPEELERLRQLAKGDDRTGEDRGGDGV